MLAMNADNASSNDTQGEALAGMPNSFVQEHRVRCFNHTLQLSAKTLLRPFNSGLGKGAEDDDAKDVDDLLDSEDESDSEDDDEGDGDGDGDDAEDPMALLDAGVIDDGIDELGALDEATRDEILTDTAAVREMVTKLRRLSFSIVRSTTIALPAWRRYCRELGIKSRILPRDVVT